MTDLLPPTAPQSAKVKKWPFVVGALILASVIGTALSKKDEPPAGPAKSGDVCFWMRDGTAGNLTPGDWQDLGEFSSHGLLVQYVSVNCPEQLPRVDG